MTVILPILIPLATAAASLLAWRSRTAQRWMGVAGATALLVAGVALLDSVRRQGIRVMQIGDWPAPFGISFVADVFASIMVVLAGLIGATVALYSTATVDRRRESYGYYPLQQVLLMGVCGAFLTGDIFNLYVWFEVMLIASFVLLALGGEHQQVEGAFKYVTLNLMSSVLFLAGVGLLYGTAGTLNLADLSLKLSHSEHSGLSVTLAVLLLVAFGIKAAVFPLFFWLPASYHTPPAAVSALFAGLLTKVGVYALVRVFTLLFVQDTGYTHSLILVLSGLTMVTGVLGAAAHDDFRRILSFHIVSQIGYMILGLGLFTPLALAGTVFYIAHHIVVKTNLFLISGVVSHLAGTGLLKQLGGFYADRFVLGILFLVPALSLAGVPPLSGFFAKLALVMAGLEVERYTIVAVALLVSLLTLFSMMKIWTQVFWKPAPPQEPPGTNPSWSAPGLWVPIVLLATITLFIGLTPQWLFDFCREAGNELANPTLYRQAVLGAVR
ncbi:MAG: Na+/H+ antiporter subunit D [Acidobacteriota bacterium]